MKPREGRKDIAGIQSIEVGAQILFALARIGKPATLSQISAETGAVPAKLHRYLASMLKVGLVTQPKKSGVYSLGAGAIQIGLSAIQHNDFCTVMGQRLNDIRDALEVTCFAAVLGNQGPTVFAQALASNTVAVVVRVGSVLSLETSATGWAFGAYMSDSQYHALCKTQRINAPDHLKRRYSEIRKIGCACITDEYMRGISAIAYPVLGLSNTLQGVVTALGPTGDFDNSPRGRISGYLRETCKQVGLSLGHAASP